MKEERAGSCNDFWRMSPPSGNLFADAIACACLYGLLPSLHGNYAELIKRIDLDGESPAEIAKELKISRNNLTVRLHRARQALRTSLEDACGICSRHGCLNRICR